MKNALFLFTAGLLSLTAAAKAPYHNHGAERTPTDRDSLAAPRHHAGWQEQIQARKAAYFTAKLELTPDEAQAFWPVHNEYWQKRHKLFAEQRSLTRPPRQLDDKKAQQMVQQIVECAQREASLLREYSEQFAKVLPPQKLLRYYAAEESFKVELINDLRKKKK